MKISLEFTKIMVVIRTNLIIHKYFSNTDILLNIPHTPFEFSARIYEIQVQGSGSPNSDLGCSFHLMKCRNSVTRFLT